MKVLGMREGWVSGYTLAHQRGKASARRGLLNGEGKAGVGYESECGCEFENGSGGKRVNDRYMTFHQGSFIYKWSVYV